MSECFFCNLPGERIIDESDNFRVIRDGFPVTEGHTLIIPKKHKETFFNLAYIEMHEVNKLLVKHKGLLQEADPSIKGFNIGMNCGKTAGQTVMHCHIHLIPRREGDMIDPRGGVRGVIPEKQKY